ncbi:hypothetical protein VCSRO159_2277 [Vibrio cholerae]|nr:hypothetical protein VCSRO159_2277 [Vibrio cholerae]
MGGVGRRHITGLGAVLDEVVGHHVDGGRVVHRFNGNVHRGTAGIAISIDRHIVKADVAVEVGIRHKGHTAVGGNLHSAVGHHDALGAASQLDAVDRLDCQAAIRCLVIGQQVQAYRAIFVDGVLVIDRIDRVINIHTALVTRGAIVSSRIRDARIYLVVPFRQRGGHIHAVAAVRLYRSGQGLLVAVGIGHDQGNGTARRGIRRAGNGRGGVVGVVRRIDRDHWRSHINTAIVGRGARVTGRIGDAGRYLIAAFRQRSGHIYAVTTIRLHGGSQGLLNAIGIGHHQSDRTAWNRIGSTSDSRCGVVGVIRCINSDS